MKLKKVEIQAFRIYDKESDGTFGFETPSGETADFVSIYAPNGFGKTSFYDAIEWAFTNQVERIAKEEVLVKKDKEEGLLAGKTSGRMILRNNTSTIWPTSVKVYRAVGDPIENFITKKPAKNSTDLNAGTRKHPKGFGFLKKTLLQQEKIETFLRVDDAKNRFKIWSQELSAKDLNPYYRTIVNLCSRNDENISELTNEKRGLEKKGFSGDSKRLKVINEHIASAAGQGSKLTPIDESFTNNKWLDFVTQLAVEIADAKSTILSSRKREDNLRALITGNDEIVSVARYVDVPRLIEELEKERTSLGKIEDALESLAANESRLTSIQSDLGADMVLANEIRGLLKRFPAYLKVQAEIKAAEDELETARTRLVQSEERVGKLEEQANEVTLELADHRTRESVLRSAIESFPVEAAELDRLETVKAASASEIEKFKSELKSVSGLHVTRLRSKLANIDRIIDELLKNNFSVKIETIDPSLKASLRTLKDLQRAHSAANLRLNEIDQRIKDHSHLKSDIEQLVNVGLNIITSTEQTTCPLCEQSYSTFQDLRSRLENNASFSAASKTLATERKSIQSDLQNITAEQKRENNALRKTLGELRASLEAEIETALGKAAELETALEAAQRSLADADHSHTVISSRFLGLEPAAYIKKIKADLAGIWKKIAAEQKRFEQVQRDSFAARGDAANERDRIAGIERRVLDHRKDMAFTQFAIDAGSQGLELPVTKDDLEARLSGIENLRQQNAAELDALSRAIKKQRKSVSGHTAKLIEERLEKLAGSIESYKTASLKFESFAGHELGITDTGLLTEENLKVLFSEAKEESEKISNLQLILSKIDSLKDSILVFLEYWEDKAKIEALASSLKAKEKLRILLGKEKDKVALEIRESVRDYFQEELINRLYQSIDPHPFYNTVEFNCNFEDREPTLDILVRQNNNESERIVPNLYYSSAQLNVLSLSIFLARAIEAKDGGYPVECIFIDDPVQAMDSINILSTIDLLRSIVVNQKKQIILSTHDENFHNLLKRKIPSDLFRSRFIELETYGKVKKQAQI